MREPKISLIPDEAPRSRWARDFITRVVYQESALDEKFKPDSVHVFSDEEINKLCGMLGGLLGNEEFYTITKFYGIELGEVIYNSMDEVADFLGISRREAIIYQSRALRKIRARKEKFLEWYLGTAADDCDDEIRLENVDFDTETYWILSQNGFEKLSDLDGYCALDLMSIPGLDGYARINEIELKLEKYGFELCLDPDDPKDWNDPRLSNAYWAWRNPSFGANPTSLRHTGLSFKAYKSLRLSGIETLNDVSSLSCKELRSIAGIGAKTFEDICQTLHRYGLKLADE